MGIITDRDWVIDELSISGYEAVFQEHDLNKDKITDIATIASYLYYCGCITETSRNTWNNINHPGNAAFITRNAYKELIESNAESLYAKMIISPFGNNNRLLSLKHIVPAGIASGTLYFNDSNNNQLNSYVTGVVINCKNGVQISSNVVDSTYPDRYKNSIPITSGTQKIPIGKYEIDFVDLSHNGYREVYTPSSTIYVEVTASTSETLGIEPITISN